MIKGRKSFGIIWQVAILFILATILVGANTYVAQHAMMERSVKNSTASRAISISKEVNLMVKQYPAYKWLLRYWYEHYDEMDVDYDSDFRAATRTEQKCWLMELHQPDLQLRYANTTEIEALPEEDQKLYAEIIYSWLLTQMNEAKRSHKIAFLFLVVSEEPFDKQWFMMSAADEGAERGSTYGQVYPLGTVAESITDDTQEVMKQCAENNEGSLADANAYMDYYAYIDHIDEHVVMAGVTYDISEIQASVNAQTRREAIFVVLHLIILALLCLLLIYYLALRPLKSVQKNIRFYQVTKNSDIVTRNLSEIKSHNELGQLSRDVISLTQEIDDYVSRLSSIMAERERIGAELSVANRIQTSMLPSTFPAFPERNEFDIFASMEPAKEVGGDFYDFFFTDENHLCMVIADVSGKGVPAALFMMACKIIIANHAKMGKSPAQILTDANTSIAANNPEEMFVTVWIGILELSTGKLTTANAGHEYPVIRHPGGQFELWKEKHGFIIGGMDNMVYQEHTAQLEPGSTLFVYTDGLPEATNADQELFGTDRMLTALNQDPEAQPEELLANVTKAVEDFDQEAEQFDDLTMLCLVYKGADA